MSFAPRTYKDQIASNLSNLGAAVITFHDRKNISQVLISRIKINYIVARPFISRQTKKEIDKTIEGDLSDKMMGIPELHMWIDRVLKVMVDDYMLQNFLKQGYVVESRSFYQGGKDETDPKQGLG